MAKKAKLEPIDGFGPKERQKVSTAIRQVWYRSRSRALVIKRCTGPDGFLYCEKADCKKRTPKIQVDHITPVGALDEGAAILRLFCPSNRLRGWCPPCHKALTKKQTQARAKKKKAWENI